MSDQPLQSLIQKTIIQTTKYVYFSFLFFATILLIANIDQFPLKIHFQEFILARLSKVMFYALIVSLVYFWLKKSTNNLISTVAGAAIHVGLLSLLFRLDDMGDGYQWTSIASVSNNLSGSEILACFIYRLAFLSGFPFAWVAPIFGFVLILTILLGTKKIASAFGADQERIRPYAYLFYAASPIPFLFLPGYTENTFLSLPALYLALIYLVEFLGKAHNPRAIYHSTLWFGIAAYVHGVGISLMPLLPIACALRFRLEPSFYLFWKRIGLCVLIGVGVSSVVHGLLNLFGFLIVFINRGQDDSYLELAMFARSHAILATNIIFITMPCFPIWLFIFYSKFWNKIQSSIEIFTLLIAAIVGFYSFAYLYGFDLGFPMDLDIMITLGITIPLFFTCLYAKIFDWNIGGRLLSYLAILNGCVTWWTLSPMIRTGILFKIW